MLLPVHISLPCAASLQPTCHSSSVWCMRPSCSVTQGKARSPLRRYAKFTTCDWWTGIGRLRQQGSLAAAA